MDNVLYIAPGQIRVQMRERMTRRDRLRESLYFRLAMSYWPPIRPLSIFACRRLGELDAVYRQPDEVVRVRLHQ